MASSKQDPQPPPIEVRDSAVHGKGVFAARQIKKGERIIEYLGERVSHDEADRRYEEKDENDSHTFLFIVDSKTVIDAGTDGNDARFFNHSCDPNCESVVESRRVFIEALRPIAPGEEMTYDYQIYREEGDPENIDEVFACRCGFPQCRGTMLWPPEPKVKKKNKGNGHDKGRSAATGKQKKTKSAPAKRSAAGRNSGSGKTSAAVKSAAAVRKSTGGEPAGSGKASAGGKTSGSGPKSAAGRKSGSGGKSAGKAGSAQKSASKAVKKSVRRP